MREINVDTVHDSLIKEKPLLAFSKENNYQEWKKKIQDKYMELLGLDVIAENACELPPEIEEVYETDEYIRYRYVFESEHECFVPCYLMLPKHVKKDKLPVVICLQGHSSGFHISIGVKKNEGDERWLATSTFALDAVKRGYAALAIEQRGFGERITPRMDRRPQVALPCYFTSMTALLLGRTLIGERVWDISKAIDTLSELEGISDKLDLNDITALGNSGGGTATYYAACFDKRIKAAVPCCSICTYKDSIAEVIHCTCNYIPNIGRYMDMGELAALIAPRKLLICNGEKDPIFLLKGTKEVYHVIEQIYEEENAKENCKLVIFQEKEHYFDREIVFSNLDEMRKK